jgi:SPP1 gp7 family putative phage head morphogenesis protein
MKKLKNKLNKKGYRTIITTNKNKRAEVYYRKATENEVAKYVNSLEIADNLEPNRNKEDIFLKNTELIVHKFLNTLKEDGKRYLNASIGKFLDIDPTEDQRGAERVYDFIGINYDREIYDNMFKILLDGNVKLIKNVADNVIESIQQDIYGNLIGGQLPKNLEQLIKEHLDTGKSRIKLIARDQTAKANQVLNRIGQQEADIEYFRWSTAKDERVSEGRGGHRQLEGKIYKWNEPESYPIINSNGEKGIPSQRPNCRCEAQGVVIEEGYKAVKLEDGSYKIIENLKIDSRG